MAKGKLFSSVPLSRKVLISCANFLRHEFHELARMVKVGLQFVRIRAIRVTLRLRLGCAVPSAVKNSWLRPRAHTTKVMKRRSSRSVRRVAGRPRQWSAVSMNLVGPTCWSAWTRRSASLPGSWPAAFRSTDSAWDLLEVHSRQACFAGSMWYRMKQFGRQV